MHITTKLAAVIGLSVALSGLVGCMTPIKPTADETRYIADKLTYFQDSRTRLCFAAVTSNNTYGSVVSITNVACEKINGQSVEP